MSLWSTALVGSTAIGAPIVGATAQLTNPRWGIALGAIAYQIAAVIGWWPSSAQRH